MRRRRREIFNDVLNIAKPGVIRGAWLRYSVTAASKTGSRASLRYTLHAPLVVCIVLNINKKNKHLFQQVRVGCESKILYLNIIHINDTNIPDLQFKGDARFANMHTRRADATKPADQIFSAAPGNQSSTTQLVETTHTQRSLGM